MTREAIDSRQLARRARLRYASDQSTGLARVRSGNRFSYRDSHGRRVGSRRIRQRIERLAIPPAWTDVWICPHANGHLQATGRDAKGRKQYLYHVTWQEQASSAKFDKLRQFGEALPDLRRTVSRHLTLPGLSRNKVLATIVALLDRTLMRVGNEEYVEANGSHGLSTLRDGHARIRGNGLRLAFPGKSGVRHAVEVNDARLARIVRQCQELPGQQLFQYRDEKKRCRVESADVNRYLQSITGLPFTAKDFRTWSATAIVLESLLAQSSDGLPATATRRAVSQAVRQAAAALGNTVTICREYYVHPQVIKQYIEGDLAQLCGRIVRRRRQRMAPREQQLLRFLRRLD